MWEVSNKRHLRPVFLQEITQDILFDAPFHCLVDSLLTGIPADWFSRI
jgi:hypothetical protein